MKFQLFRQDSAFTTNEIFRVASLFLYITLLLHLVLSAGSLQFLLNGPGGISTGLFTLLFAVSLGRFVWPKAMAYGQTAILVELGCATLAIVLLSSHGPTPMIPLPWLIGVAGVFPLALTGGIALCSTIAIAAIGFIINARLGMSTDSLIPRAYATLFVGLLAILLARALNLSRKALDQADTNDRRFDAIARATRHIVMIVDDKYRVMYVNPAIQEITGYTEEEVRSLTMRELNHPDDAEEHKRKLRYLRNTPHASIFSRHRTRHKDGRWVWVEAAGYNMLHDPAIRGLVFSIEDISARKEAERRLGEEHALLRAVLDHNPSMIYAKDTEGRYTISNQTYQNRFGYSSEDNLRGKKSHEVFLNQIGEGQEQDAYRIAEELHQQDLQVMQSGEPMLGMEMQGLWENDPRTWYRINKYPLRDADNRITGVLGITSDITDRKEYEMRLENQALHDPLTGLPNRRYVLRKIADAIAGFREHKTGLTILFCDLDFFKSVNDIHGHDFGDKCLLELTRRILTELPVQDSAARFGGNEFIVLTGAGLDEARRKADALLKAVSRELVIDDVAVRIQASIGIALLNEDHKSPSELIRDADTAMYQAKERGRNRAEVFNTGLQDYATRRARMDAALRFALERNELVPLFQPKISLADGSIRGFEILLRWNSPQHGVIPPNEFIPIAEHSGMIVPIGLWAMEQACKQMRSWQDLHGATGLSLAVNVSMRQLMQTSFLADVTAILEKTGVAPASIELELTETSAMANPLQTIETLSMLKKLGLRLALDDFGTGYSSLAYLQKLPLDVLKIDKTFVHGLDTNSGDAEIVRLILALAQTLNLETVAEGVESAGQMRLLKEMGCQLGQGYVFSPSIPAAEAESLLRAKRPFTVA